MARGTFGERLKRERDLREVPLDEVAKATRITTRYLEALENEQWEKLPGGLFARGFVRTVARYLGLDEEALLAEYDLARGDQTPPPLPSEHTGIPRPPLWPFAVAALLIFTILVAGGIYGWRRYSTHRAMKRAYAASVQQPSQAAPAPTSIPSAATTPSRSPAVPPPSSAASVKPPHAKSPSSASSISSTSSTSATLLPARPRIELSISASAPTRVRVVGDRHVLMDRHLRAGQSRHFTAKDHFEITADDFDAVLLELNGQVMSQVGAPGASGTITLSRKDLRPAGGGNSQP